MRHLVAAVVVLTLMSATASADVTQGQLLPKTRPGGDVSLGGTNLDTKKAGDYIVSFRGAMEYAVPVERVESARLVLRVPGDFTAGPYLVYVRVEGGAPLFVAQIEVVPVMPQIERVAVISTWSKLFIDGQFDFKMVGDRLCIDSARKQRPCDDGALPTPQLGSTGASEPLTLYLDKERFELRRCTEASVTSNNAAAKPVTTTTLEAPKPATPPASEGNGGQATNPTASRPPLSSDTLRKDEVRPLCYWPETPQALTIHGLDVSEYGGPHEMAVEIAGLRSSTVPLRVSRVTARMIKWISLALLVAFVATFGLIGTTASTVPGRSGRSSLLTWVMLDPETNTYSLSKVQLLLWSGAIVFSYLYLLLAYVLTQGTLEFPPLPTSLSWVILGTGGTSLAAAKLSSTRGPKGSGAPDPSFSDLVSSGGVLAADRAQYFIWTLIGVGGFLLLVLRQMPDQITRLPDVSAELLAAMGVSASVYVLGKTVRLPGPVITTAAVSSAAGAATFDLKIDGQNLHEKATISVDGQVVADAKIIPPPTPPPSPLAPGMLPQLDVKLPPDGPWKTGDHLLRVTNQDGQFSEIWFTATPPKLTTVAPASIPVDVETQVTLTGTDLRPASKAEWLASGTSAPTLIAVAKVSVQPTTATVSFNPGKVKGAGTLTLVSPHGMRTSQTVTVI